DDGEADHPGGHPAVQQEHGEGEGGAGARAAPPAGAAERHQVADDDAGQHGQRPADGTGREECVVFAEGAVEAGAEDESGGRGAHATRPDARQAFNGTAFEPSPRLLRSRGYPNRSWARQAHISTVGRRRLLRAAVVDGCPNAPRAPVCIWYAPNGWPSTPTPR